MKKIAFISYNMYPYLYRPDLKISGGAELQLLTLAKHLSTKGFQVVFFTGDFGQEQVVTKDNFVFYKLEINGAGKFEKVYYFIKLIRKIKPDLILERGTSVFTFLAVLLSKVFRIPFIFCGASDINFAKNEIDPFFGGSKIKQRLYQWSILRISHFVVQKNSQAKLLCKNYGIEKNVTIIRNFPPDGDVCFSEELHRQFSYEYDAIWVANLIPYKQPELFIELAKCNPGYKFLLIGASADKEYQKKINEIASEVKNVTAPGYIPPKEVLQWMRKCRIAVNTTCVATNYEEGFSNVQLMGWMCGIPSLALISDPDNVIVSNQMGFRSGTFAQLCQDFHKLADDEELYTLMSKNAVRYVSKNHDKEELLQQYLQVLNQY